MSHTMFKIALAVLLAGLMLVSGPVFAQSLGPQCHAPDAVDDVYEVMEDHALAPAAPGVLLNDTDPSGETLTAAVVQDPANGVLVLNSDGSFTYTPNPAFVGEDTFTYRAMNQYYSMGYSDEATVTVTVTPMPRLYLPVIMK